MPSTRSGASYNCSSSPQKGYRRDYGRSQSATEGQGSHFQQEFPLLRSGRQHCDNKPVTNVMGSILVGDKMWSQSNNQKLLGFPLHWGFLPFWQEFPLLRSGRQHCDSQPEGLQKCIAAQRVPDPFRSVEKLHELLPDCEITPGTSQHLKVTQSLESIDGKGNMMLLTEEWRKNNPPLPKQVPKTAPVARSTNYNVKKQPQAQNKGKGKAPAKKTYSQGYRIPKIQQDSMENVFQVARTMMELQKKKEARLKYQK
ncbi:hypothetical protein O181_017298 [Austropuccinia psidii MF-1]|uniref:Uncharacterized protein n=1 Tax=Austropuccinia psidii MF-1 TaxID=1389203 RepID=A0A9Q3C6V3_9BASI|nr:hypothetical protein [Austropuccinia psidii MF-1]